MRKFTINMEQKVKQFNKEANKSGLFNKIEAYNLIKDSGSKIAKQMRKEINQDVTKLFNDLKFTPEQIWLNTTSPRKEGKHLVKKAEDNVIKS